MRTKKIKGVLPIAILLLIVGVFIWSSHQKETMICKLPVWELGTQWIFDLSQQDAEYLMTVKVTDEDNIGGRSCYVLTYSYEPPIGMVTGSRVWVEKSTLAGIKTQILQGENVLSESTSAPMFSKEMWPLRASKEFTLVENLLGSQLTYTVKVEGVESVNVPAGTFECFKVAYYLGDQIAKIEWYSAQTKWFVKLDDRMFQRLFELESYLIES
jgi:hypothetical protein